jgi:NAD(P)-dependent dehydrogenase (short-subunit alcohol dehydrogenase family)
VSGVALLIGNSDGIGLALTRRLLEGGFAVTGVSKSPSPVSHDAYRHIVLDVSSADYGTRLDAALPSGRIRLCVYCAGIGDHFAMDGLHQDVATLQVNLVGLAKTVERVLPRMVADGPAVLAGLSSLADVTLSRVAPARPLATPSSFRGAPLRLTSSLALVRLDVCASPAAGVSFRQRRPNERKNSSEHAHMSFGLSQIRLTRAGRPPWSPRGHFPHAGGSC